MFQSTRPRGARPHKFLDIAHANKFQSTRPRGARLSSASAKYGSSMFQSTRPRGARLELLQSTMQQMAVSIHAPTRGATLHDNALYVYQATVSIHAPTRGATYRLRCWRPEQICFNPRAHAGRDGSFLNNTNIK